MKLGREIIEQERQMAKVNEIFDDDRPCCHRSCIVRGQVDALCASRNWKVTTRRNQ